MTQPSVRINELDGALGVLPASAGRLFALVGVSSKGPVNTPAGFARVKDIVASFGAGPLVEAAAHYIDRYSKPVLLVRTAAESNIGSVDDVVAHAATGTSAVTSADTDTEPQDDYQVVLQFLKDGTVGTAGATYRTSLDGGRSFGPVTALGTGNTIAVAPGISFALAAGTVKAGDVHSVGAVAPLWEPAELGAALDALAQTTASWEQVHIVGEADPDAVALIETKFAGMHNSGRFRNWIASARLPADAETEAEYLASLSAEFGSVTTTHGAIVAGATRSTSGVSGRTYRRPFAWPFASRQGSVSEEVNVADPNLGALVGESIRDPNGNPDEHDESISPGLDDARFVTARTIDGYQGVYINRPRLFSNATSDFQLVPHRRVLNLTHAVLRAYFILRTSRSIIVNAKTGFILESEALEIEAGANAEMGAALLSKPKASARVFKLSRTDNLLSTKRLTGQGRVTPLAYPEDIELDVGFENPALQLQAV